MCGRVRGVVGLLISIRTPSGEKAHIQVKSGTARASPAEKEALRTLVQQRKGRAYIVEMQNGRKNGFLLVHGGKPRKHRN